MTNKPLLGAVAVSIILQAVIVLLPPMHDIFNVVPFDPDHWLLAVAIGILPLVAMELWKASRKKADI
jgi:Ca2+-transporting ATPase